MQSVLVVEDHNLTREALVEQLQEAGYEARGAHSLDAARALVAQKMPDAALLDIGLGDGSGLNLLEELLSIRRNLPVIMVSGFGDSERTIRAMKAGAFDYVTKPYELDALLEVLARAVGARPVAEPHDHEDEPPAGLIGRSRPMLEVWKAIGRAAASRAPVLITGESGTGKELVARAIHDHAEHDLPFVPVNLAALPSTLIESELFGHEKGAFTGANQAREGRFELAAEGSLFLDEIGDLPLHLQTKLLRVLEDGGYERIGGSERRASRARIISATSKSVGPGPESLLREDLYYRLAVLEIPIPPLRERREDIPLLVHAFLAQIGPRHRGITDQALDRLVNEEWPGNVRQLRHALENACVMSAAEVLDLDDFRMLGPAPAQARAPAPRPNSEVESELGEDLDLKANVERLERRLIAAALQRAEGNRSHAARLLGIRRALLYSKVLAYDL